MTQPFKVTWTIDINASSPEEAAVKCLEIQRDPYSAATFFQVLDNQGETHEIDLPWGQ